MLAFPAPDVPDRRARGPQIRERSYPCPDWVVEQIRLYFAERRVILGSIPSSGLLATIVDERRSEVARQADRKPPRGIYYEVYAPDGQFVGSFRLIWRAQAAIDEHRKHACRRQSGSQEPYRIRPNRLSPDLVGPKLTARGAETRQAGECSVLAWRTPGYLRRVAMAIGALADRHQEVLLAEFGLEFDEAGDKLSERGRAELCDVQQSTYRRRRDVALTLVKNRLQRGGGGSKK